MPVTLKHIYTLCLSVLIFNICNGQNPLNDTTNQNPASAPNTLYSNLVFNNTTFATYSHNLLVCKGTIPSDFITLSSESYKRSKKKIDAHEKRSIRRAKDKFYLENSYDVNELLLSGRVVFNDEASVYLNKILDKILAHDKSLRDSLRIYTIKSTVVNAMTLQNGIILVTTGLLAKIQNEAQLAYILSHEVIHYKNKHLINEYVEETKRDKHKGEYSRMSEQERKISLYTFSKEKETEADKQGFGYYKLSGYSLAEAPNSFIVLQHSEHPFDSVPFDKTFFNAGAYAIPDSLFMKAVPPIVDTTIEDDVYSTHPDLRKRIKYISDSINTANNTTGALYLISEEDFHRIQEICRYEDCILNLNRSKYYEALYSAYLLLSTHPNDLFLHKVIAKSLYGIAKYTSTGHIEVMQNEARDAYAGNIGQVHHLLDGMSNTETAILALRYASYVSAKDPKDEELTDIIDDMVYELAIKDKITFNDISKTAPSAIADTLSHSADAKNYYVYALNDLPGYTLLIDKFKKYSAERIIEPDQPFSNVRKRKKLDPHEQQVRDALESNTYALGVDNLTIVDPDYNIINESKKNVVRYHAAEDAEIKLQSNVMQCAKAADVNVNYLETKGLKADEVDKFNDIAVYNAWLSEQMDHKKMYFVNSMRPYAMKSCLKYNATNIAWLGVVEYTAKSQVKNKAGLLIACIILYPFLPVALYAIFKKDHNTLVYTAVGDVKNNKLNMVYSQYTKMQVSQAILNSTLFDIMKQVHYTRKHAKK